MTINSLGKWVQPIMGCSVLTRLGAVPGRRISPDIAKILKLFNANHPKLWSLNLWAQTIFFKSVKKIDKCGCSPLQPKCFGSLWFKSVTLILMGNVDHTHYDQHCPSIFVMYEKSKFRKIINLMISKKKCSVVTGRSLGWRVNARWHPKVAHLLNLVITTLDNYCKFW